MSGWAYILRCADASFYVGSTSHADIYTRVDEHNDARYIGYTAARRPVTLVWSQFFDDIRDAHETERRLKGWSRAKKSALISGNAALLEKLAQRRAGQSVKSVVKISKRQLVDLADATGARSMPSRSVPVRKLQQPKRTGGSDFSVLKLARSRHPEVRAGRAPKDD